MKKLFCDCCGKEITTNPDAVGPLRRAKRGGTLIALAEHSNGNTVRVEFNAYAHKGEEIGSSKDVCDECILESVAAFIKARREGLTQALIPNGSDK